MLNQGFSKCALQRVFSPILGRWGVLVLSVIPWGSVWLSWQTKPAQWIPSLCIP